MVETIRSTARALVGSDGISVVRRDGDLCHYIEEDAIGQLWKGQTFPASICVSGWAMINRKTVIIPDINLDDRIPQELYSGTFVRALLMAPVGSDEPIGAIGAYWSRPYAPTREEIDVLEALAGAAATAIENIRLIEALSGALKDAELARDELKHRVKNAYMGAQAIARLALPREQAEDLTSKLGALARAHALLDDKLSNIPTIGLRELVEAEIEPYHAGASRFLLQGPPITVRRSQAVPLGLVVNELATNALKHGALSVPDGRVSLVWSRSGSNVILNWQESGGPTVSTAPVAGQGTDLLNRIVKGQLAGALNSRFEPEGVVYTLSFRADTTDPVDAGIVTPA